jgi:hypothetical protein
MYNLYHAAIGTDIKYIPRTKTNPPPISSFQASDFEIIFYPVCTGDSFPAPSCHGMNLTTHFYPMLMLRMNGVIPPLLHMSSRCVA